MIEDECARIRPDDVNGLILAMNPMTTLENDYASYATRIYHKIMVIELNQFLFGIGNDEYAKYVDLVNLYGFVEVFGTIYCYLHVRIFFMFRMRFLQFSSSVCIFVSFQIFLQILLQIYLQNWLQMLLF